MKLELKKRTITHLSAEDQELPTAATPQVGGGTTPAITVTTVTTVFATSDWLCREPVPPKPPCTCECC